MMGKHFRVKVEFYVSNFLYESYLNEEKNHVFLWILPRYISLAV